MPSGSKIVEKLPQEDDTVLGTQAGTTSSCQACEEADTDRMVMCDACDAWYHYHCVGVGDSVSDKSFVCPKCKLVAVPTLTEKTRKEQPPLSVSSSTSSRIGSSVSTARSRLRLNMKKLEAERVLLQKQLDLERRAKQSENEMEFERRQLELDQAFHREKFKRLEEEENAENDAKSQKSILSSIRKVQQWHIRTEATTQKKLSELKIVSNPIELDNIPKTQGRPQQVKLLATRDERRQQGAVGESVEIGSRKLGAIPKASRQVVNIVEEKLGYQAVPIHRHRDYSLDISPIRTSNVIDPKPFHAVDKHTPPFPHDMRESTQLPTNRLSRDQIYCESKVLGDLVRNPPRWYDEPAFGATKAREDEERLANATKPMMIQRGGSCGDEASVICGDGEGDFQYQRTGSRHRGVRDYNPTHQQLSARQLGSKELPEFDGTPEDWPLFICTFQNTSAACGYSDDENLLRLQKCLKGPARQMVQSQLMMPSAVPSIIETLRTLYGRPEVLVHSLLQKIRQIPAPKSDRLSDLITFGMAVKNLCTHLEAAQQTAHLNNPTLLFELMEKLPTNLQLDWALYTMRFEFYDLSTFSSFMSQLVTAASRVTLRIQMPGANSIQRGSKAEKLNTRHFLGVHTELDSFPEDAESGFGERNHISTGNRPFVKSESQAGPSCFICKNPDHRVRDCSEFKRLTVENRWTKIRELGVCKVCLGYHGRRPCKSSRTCEVNGCQEKHHSMLHIANVNSENTPTTSTAVINLHQSEQSTLFRMLPVTLYGNGRSVEVLAFIDDGSSMTLLDEDIASQLEIRGEPAPLCLQWTGNVTRSEAKSQRVSLEIRGTRKSQKFPIEVRTVCGLELPNQSMCYAKLLEKYHHLQGLPIQDYQNVKPRVLIGNDNSHIGATLRIREGEPGEPIAAKCRLGWSVYGAIGEGTRRAGSFHISECKCDGELHNMVENFFSMEISGIWNSPEPQSKKNLRANKIMEQTTKRRGQRFETGLLWKYDDFEFPESRKMAERRHRCLERRMRSNPVIGDSVRKQMMDYLRKGYIHKATPEELAAADAKRTWYLPLGVALNPKKPSKIRIFCDAAAKVQGVSLNTMLLKGPDLLNSLPGVLFGFRERSIGICADIREMFHQVMIREEDRNSQRLLWRNNTDEPIETYFMDVATFGSSCSPSSAQFVKNRNAMEFAEEFPDAAEAIIKHHYVDDWLDSVDTVQEACKLAADVEYVQSQGGFKIHNWLSNSPQFLEQIGERDLADTKNLNLDRSTERVLGMLWRRSDDVFIFSLNNNLSVVHPTKREVLRAVMSVFDPLGLLAFFIVHGKIIIQDIWKTKTNWDEKITEELRDRWIQWTEQFEKLSEAKIPRCYFPNYPKDSVKDIQLHIFCDASEQAYASVAFLRAQIEGSIHCALVSGKSKVAPLKTVSIPRLELQAAVLGVRLQKLIKEFHRLSISRTVYWSDSQTVLSWIKSDHRRYRQYVACRIGEILTESSVDDWRWIPSKENVADDATKWGQGPNFSNESRWFRGPQFLYHPEGEWPTDCKISIETTEELAECLHHFSARSFFQLIRWERFSSWQTLWRSVATILKFFDMLRAKAKKVSYVMGPVTSEELTRAEDIIFKLVQKEVYFQELSALLEKSQSGSKTRTQSTLNRNSKLFRLSPFLDERGIIRLESRIIAASYVSFDTKFPIILPKEHVVTRLMLEALHKRYLHANGETVVNECRQRFHIPNLRSLVRKVSRSCPQCKIKKAKPTTPRMAALPEARLQAFVRPFTHIGLDYFGPLNVRVGRSVVKRWVALFTCLTIRAVHLEIVHSLTTESCKMAIRRFIVCHGSPLEIYSDNGTNFVGASNELKNAVDSKQLAECFTNAYTKWIFNPPAAPHMGGAWERLVRSVKVAMAAMQTLRNPDDETLATIVREAQGVVNSRPLTFIPIESESQEALTPNHFILLSSNGVTQNPKPLADDSMAHRNNWNQLNTMVDQFWRRWVREYLPTIARRTKWFIDVAPIEQGDLVIVISEAERNCWLRGRVLEVIEAKDGRRRQAIIQTTHGVLKRPVAKLARLDMECGKPRSSSASTDLSYGRGDVTATTPGLPTPPMGRN
ncbi:uncharacterized protein LOC129741562 [Uranotaenia lowii]|uniref:uncharacterized protein LOC129741562 n=2 Tax=Uranotaenia lowii TaxID=190385 RepID=UPI00247A132C|nr:uncharacterized protein LOC129741562 [Uranotaenia lowii]